MKQIVVHSKARAELDAAIAYYEQQKTGLGLAFKTVIETAVRRIQKHPQIGAPYKATDLRRYVIQRFPYTIFYAEFEKVIWVVAIAHCKRKPDYWIRRKQE